LHEPDWLPASGGAALEAIELPAARGTLRVPVDAQGAALVPYRGEQGSYRYYSAADVLAQRLPADALRGRIALLGTSAPGLLDLRVTPVAETFPGVEVHANLVSGMLDGTVKSRPPYAPGIEVALLLLIGLVMVFWLPALSPTRTTMAAGALLLLVVALDLWLWQFADLALSLAAVTVLAVVLYGLEMAVGYFLESSAKRRLTALFGQYVPPELVEEMSRNPERYDMEGRSAELTVLFADIRAFTALSEGLPPQELAQMMNEYFSAMTAVIRASRGTLDKYIGDAIMAFWGAPVDDALHARHAVAAGLQMQRRLAELNFHFADRGWPQLAIGVGINTGTMTVGDMGSRERKAYTVVGDSVNLASRLEGLTAHYGVGIIVGEATQRLLRDVTCRQIDRVRVKGRAGSVAIYEPLGAESEIGEPLRAELALWQQALARYRAQDWDAAQAALDQLNTLSGGRKLYALYLSRIATLRAQPPGPAWDAVWQFETK
jgi:adenylate cyclase